MKNTYGSKIKYKRMLWINVLYPRNLAMKVSVTDIAKLPTISNIEVAAVICALITMVLMFLSVVDLDDTAGATFLDDGLSFLKMRIKLDRWY